MKRFCVLVGLLAIAVIAATAQSSKQVYYIGKLGRDTIAVEQYTFSGHELKGTSVVRTPRTMVREYAAEYDPAGEITHFHMTLHRPGGPTTGERDYVYRGDSVASTFKQDTVTRTSVVEAKGHPIPLFVDLYAGWAIAVHHAVQEGHAREFGVLAGREVLHYTVKGNVPGTLEVSNQTNDFSPIRATVDREGDVETIDMTATTDKFIAERTEKLDVEALAKSFVTREAEGKSLGVLSPRDTVKAEIAGAHMLIDYSRPAARGRKIFGGVVPWGEVWRTGANAATQLVTDKGLVFGSTTVPPGTYSIFTLPSEHGWQLIINNQHGQWGTVYDQSKDLVRLPLTVKQLSSPTERFTFAIRPEGNGGELSFMWANTEASLPFSVKQ